MCEREDLEEREEGLKSEYWCKQARVEEVGDG